MLVMLVLMVGCETPVVPEPLEPRQLTAVASALAPAAPGSLTATATAPNRVVLTWIDNSDVERFFTVNRRTLTPTGWSDYVLIERRLPPNTTSYADTTAASSTRYRYRVAACNAAGCNRDPVTSEVSTPLGPPTAPGGLTGAAVGTSRIDLTWVDNSGSETSFELHRTVDLGGGFDDWTALWTAGRDATGRSDSGLTPGGRYRYRLRACNTAGCSGWVESAVLQLPLAPPVLIESVVSMTDVEILWSDGNANVARYQIRRRTHSGEAWGAFGIIATDLPPTTVRYWDSGLTALTRYEYGIRACNTGGCSAWTVLQIVTPLVRN
jgi:titin